MGLLVVITIAVGRNVVFGSILLMPIAFGTLVYLRRSPLPLDSDAVKALAYDAHLFLGDGPIRTERLELRAADQESLPELAAMYDEEYRRTNHWTPEQLNAQIKLHRKQSFFTSEGARMALLWLPGEESLVGHLSIAVEDDKRTIGAYLRSEFRGHGYFSEALTATLPALKKNRLTPIRLACDVANHAMIESATRAGMSRLRNNPSWRHPNGTTSEAAVFVWPSA